MDKNGSRMMTATVRLGKIGFAVEKVEASVCF